MYYYVDSRNIFRSTTCGASGVSHDLSGRIVFFHSLYVFCTTLLERKTICNFRKCFKLSKHLKPAPYMGLLAPIERNGNDIVIMQAKTFCKDIFVHIFLPQNKSDMGPYEQKEQTHFSTVRNTHTHTYIYKDRNQNSCM